MALHLKNLLIKTKRKKCNEFTVLKYGSFWSTNEMFNEGMVLQQSSKILVWGNAEPTMIEQWRTDFKNPKMPFLFVQLPSYANADAQNKAIWPELREAQLLTLQKVKNTGMAVTIDLGEKTNIHPTNKKPVGKRLSAIALNTVYGFEIPFSGPIYSHVKFNNNKAILTFDYIYSGLMVENGDLKGFSICGEDKKFVEAKAEIVNNQVIVTCDKIANPIAVRYGWANWTDANLKNNEGFMASPFRIDNFELLTQGAKAPVYK